MRKNKRVLLGSGIASVAILAATAVPAFACNQGTVNGVHTTDCSVAWNAESVYSSDVSLYPAGLLTEPDGVTPVGGGALGGNGGYVSEVSPVADPSDPGILEINRFINGDYTQGTGTINVRIPVATTHPIGNAQMRVTLPTLPSGGQWSLSSDVGVPSARWGASYAPFTWSASTATPSVPSNGGSFTVALGDLAANQGTVIQFTAPVTAADLAVLTDYQATLTGEYAVGAGCVATQPPSPVQVPTTRTYLVQADRYSPVISGNARATAANERLVASLDDDGVLRYREDMGTGCAAAGSPTCMWYHAQHTFVAVKVTTVDGAAPTAGQLMRAYNRKAPARYRITTTARTGSVTRPTVEAWVLGRGATVALPWGRSHAVNQRMIGHN